MSHVLDELRRRMAKVEAEGQHRVLEVPRGIDFSSNDYLGFSQHPALRAGLLARLETAEPVGSHASRLLGGHTPAHGALESRLAALKGTESALLFSSGYAANVGLLSSLATPADRILSDAQNHASIIDGVRLSGCSKVVYPHLNMAALEAALAIPHPGGQTFVVTESLFSMDGDIAPLAAMADLCERYGAGLIVDDSHGIGVYGDSRASGLTEVFGVERRCLAVMSTTGKALAVSGGFVAGSALLMDYLINHARAFIFSTAVPPMVVHGIESSLDLLWDKPARGRRAVELAERLRMSLAFLGLDCLRAVGPIVPVVLGDNQRALRVARVMRDLGFDVRAIRPPTVAPGTARLRISIHANHTEEQVDALGQAIARAVDDHTV